MFFQILACFMYSNVHVVQYPLISVVLFLYIQLILIVVIQLMTHSKWIIVNIPTSELVLWAILYVCNVIRSHLIAY